MTTVLIAGATGTLGSRIAFQLTNTPNVELRLLVRSGWEHADARRARIQPLLDAGAIVETGDVADPDTLPASVAGADVVVSALQGGRDVIVDGQITLAHAAAEAGARRFIPSDFAIDLFRAPDGAPQFEARKDADRAIESTGLEVLHVLNGAFMDQMFNPRFTGLIDVTQGTVTYWGTGDVPFDLSTLDDTAKFTARLAVDATAEPGTYAISAGPVTYNRVAQLVSEAAGVAITPHVLGDATALRARVAAVADPWEAMYDWYHLAMLETPTFTTTHNERYADARPVSVEEYIASAYDPAT